MYAFLQEPSQSFHVNKCTEPVQNVQNVRDPKVCHQALSECFLAAAGGLEVRVRLTKVLPQHLREEKIRKRPRAVDGVTLACTSTQTAATRRRSPPVQPLLLQALYCCRRKRTQKAAVRQTESAARCTRPRSTWSTCERHGLCPASTVLLPVRRAADLAGLGPSHS